MELIQSRVSGGLDGVYDGIRDLPRLRVRYRPDPEGELGAGVYLGFQNRDQRDAFMQAMKAENVPANPPEGSVILPVQPYIEGKMTVHPAWPSFTSERGRSIQYGAAACPRTIQILNRFGGVRIDPKFTKNDTADIVAAIRKVYPAVARGMTIVGGGEFQPWHWTSPKGTP